MSAPEDDEVVCDVCRRAPDDCTCGGSSDDLEECIDCGGKTDAAGGVHICVVVEVPS